MLLQSYTALIIERAPIVQLCTAMTNRVAPSTVDKPQTNCISGQHLPCDRTAFPCSLWLTWKAPTAGSNKRTALAIFMVVVMASCILGRLRCEETSLRSADVTYVSHELVGFLRRPTPILEPLIRD